uniref:Transcription factor CBF/NF-Y/archaeal histone domain-containing protein n=1 Tax=Brassica campestris TaxID=3711 RepID=A0A3P6BVS8_BRACM|nr:unnamed protein product [Brassica rapa]
MPPEQDQYLPIASVTRIMRKILPSEARISEEAKENIQICATKYISFVTAEAGDILSAMSNIGFEDYVEPLNVFIHRYRLSETDRGCSLRGETSSFHGPPHYGPTPHGPPPHGTIPYGPLPHVPPPPGPMVTVCWISLWIWVVVIGTTQTGRVRM